MVNTHLVNTSTAADALMDAIRGHRARVQSSQANITFKAAALATLYAAALAFVLAQEPARTTVLSLPIIIVLFLAGLILTVLVIVLGDFPSVRDYELSVQMELELASLPAAQRWEQRPRGDLVPRARPAAPSAQMPPDRWAVEDALAVAESRWLFVRQVVLVVAYVVTLVLVGFVYLVVLGGA